MRLMRQIHPLAYIIGLLISASLGLLAVVPFVSVTSAPVPASAEAPPPVFPQEWEPRPQTCLSDEPPHYYVNHKVDKRRAGPGSEYKESKHAFGPSAVPVNVDTLTEEERLVAVKTEFIRRHCGDRTIGGDKKLFQIGFPGSDVNNLTAAPNHPHMNPNTPLSREHWEIGLGGYLETLRWDKSYLVRENLGPDTWTLSMIPQSSREPKVVVNQDDQPMSWYLMLAVTQPDGSIVLERRRLDCGFQTTYNSYEDVPAAYK